MNNEVCLESMQGVIYYIKHVSSIIYNRSTRKHKSVLGSCVLSELCLLFSTQLMTMPCGVLGNIFKGIHGGIPSVGKQHIESARHKSNC